MKRYAFLRWLRKISNTPEGCVAPQWIKFIYYILFPLNWFYEKQSNIKYDILSDIYTINGMKFTGEVFYHLRSEASKGMKFRLIDTGEYVTIETLK